MHMTVTEIFLIAMLIIFTFPYLVWRVGNTDSFAPLVVVQIVAGILLGPGVLGAALPEMHAFIFSPPVITALNGIAWWAVILFVWTAGIELDLTEAWKHRKETSIVAGFALFMPLLFGCAAAVALLAWTPSWMGPHGQRWQFIAGVGMACAVTALPILVLFLEKLAILRRPLGQRVLRYASFDDVAIWAVLALVLLDWDRIGRQGMFLVGFGFAAWAFRALMKRVPETDRWYLGLVWLAACAFVADWAGLHYMVGAFLSGVVLDAAWFDRKRMDFLRDSLLLTIMPVFFLSTGLRTNWSIGAQTVFIAAALLLFVSVSGKLLGVSIAGRILKWPRGEARAIGWLLQTKALIEIIFANVLLDKGIISSETFTALLLMAVASTTLSIPMLRGTFSSLGAHLRPTGMAELPATGKAAAE
jgi:Kef-type K+ transport system membrane component KefB